MTQKSHGPRAKTRKRLKQPVRYRPTITKFLKEFQIGEKVVIDPEPSSQRGMPHVRYRGRVGEIIGKRGNAYIVAVKVGSKTKQLISAPEHLKEFK